MCKEMPVIPVNRVLDKKRIIEQNLGPRRRRHKGLLTHTKKHVMQIKCASAFVGPVFNFFSLNENPQKPGVSRQREPL
jgi:hypothetical protein